jgi:hypothetical protein
LLADEHVSPKLDLIAGVTTDPESFPLPSFKAWARARVIDVAMK